ncbi:hypothetical protein ALI144C_48695 [Actinosynnema sp. ALI-1.44]|nr:hypothetical protein ALI144C_48695 [Actinosynnema sp. ALI-1.44]
MFVTYTHDSEEHKNQVLALAAFLRSHGLDVQLDAWDSYKRRDWYEWGQRQIMLADFILVVVSKQYRRVGDGEVESMENRGAQAEVAALREVMQYDRPQWIQRILPVLLPGHSPDEIPLFLQPLTADHFKVKELTLAGADSLIRVLTAQPANALPPIGTVPTLGQNPVPEFASKSTGTGLVQVDGAQGEAVVFAVQDGDLHVTNPPNVPRDQLNETPWSRLTAPLKVDWHDEPGTSGVLELHLVPVGEVDPLQTRRLQSMPDALAALGRREGLFTNAEGLSCDSSADSAWAKAVSRPNGDAAGLAVTRTGCRTAWSALPRDMVGSILDRHDLVQRIGLLLQTLVRVEGSLPARVAPAVGIRAAAAVAEGSVARMPRTSAVFPSRLRQEHIRLPAAESVSASLLVDDSAEVVEELAARLLAEFREASR